MFLNTKGLDLRSKKDKLVKKVVDSNIVNMYLIDKMVILW